jgi:hypothetical protein
MATAQSTAGPREALDKLCKARNDGNQYSKPANDIDAQTKNLDSQLAVLRTQRAVLKSQRTALLDQREVNDRNHEEWLSAIFDDTIVPYAQAWNLRFAEQMQSCLPPELRQLVYSYLWDEDSRQEYDMWLAHDAFDGKPCTRRPCKCLPNGTWELPHFTLPAYVGPAMALETVEVWYKHPTTSHFVRENDLTTFICNAVPHVVSFAKCFTRKGHSDFT